MATVTVLEQPGGLGNARRKEPRLCSLAAQLAEKHQPCELDPKSIA